MLRDATLVFIGLGELTPKVTERLFRFRDVAEVPAGIESILEEAFLSQAPQADRKSSIEHFFKGAGGSESIEDALVLLEVARHLTEWKEANKRLKVLNSPHGTNADLFALAREVVA